LVFMPATMNRGQHQVLIEKTERDIDWHDCD
jgi:hypothetical protein